MSSPGAAGGSWSARLVGTPSLPGGPLGDDPGIWIAIVLPDGYEKSASRCPVVYVLSDDGDDADRLARPLACRPGGSGEGSSSGVVAGPAGGSGAIYVVASGRNAVCGSFYTYSAGSGDWEDAIARDLVGFIDARYRTIAARASRGIAGRAVGGLGALNLAMRRPDVFGAVWALSPTLIDPNRAWPERIRRGGPDLRALRGIAIEYGRQDVRALAGARDLAAELEAAGIDCLVTAFDDGGSDAIDERLVHGMVPFMAERLAGG